MSNSTDSSSSNVEDPHAEPVFQRRKSINVASLLRGGDENPKSSSVIRENEEVKRRSSINLASLSRESHQDLDRSIHSPHHLIHWRRTCVVGSEVVRRHTTFLQAANNTHADNRDQRNDSRRQVQFASFEVPNEEEEPNNLESPTNTLRQRAVTFGAYYDAHNNSMIPELVQLETAEDKEQKETQLIRRIQRLFDRAHPSIQILSTIASCLLTYSIVNREPHLEVKIATQILVTLCGATFPHLITAVACGVYVGSASPDTIPSYPWVLILGVITALCWQLVSSTGLILGYSGRLGSTAFLGMNLTGLLVFAFSDSVSFSRFGSLETLWKDMLTLEESLVSLLGCVFVAVSAGYFRLVATIPVNPVLVPSTWALFCMLVTTISEYRFSSSMLGGYAVGAYVAMASEARISSLSKYCLVGFLAGLWNILLQPFFLGFGGKGGFTSMVGYSTYLFFETCWNERKRIFGASNQEQVLPK